MALLVIIVIQIIEWSYNLLVNIAFNLVPQNHL